MWTLVQSTHHPEMVMPRLVLPQEDDDVINGGGIVVNSFEEVQKLELEVNGQDLLDPRGGLVFSETEIGGQKLFVKVISE